MKLALENFSPRKLMVIPIIFFLFSISIIFYNYFQTGDFFLKDIDLMGGTLITIETENQVNAQELEKILSEKYGLVSVSSLVTKQGYGANIKVSADVSPKEIVEFINTTYTKVLGYGSEYVGPELGELFFSQVVRLVSIAYILMSIAIYLIYRQPLLSFGIVFASAANLIDTLALTIILGIRISFAGFAGMLMLMGYAVDTNIVLTSHTIKAGKEKFKEEYRKALITGLTVTATTVVAMLLTMIFSTSHLLTNIAQILAIGFSFDVLNTWILNASLIQKFLTKAEGV